MRTDELVYLPLGALGRVPLHEGGREGGREGEEQKR